MGEFGGWGERYSLQEKISKIEGLEFESEKGILWNRNFDNNNQIPLTPEQLLEWSQQVKEFIELVEIDALVGVDRGGRFPNLAIRALKPKPRNKNLISYFLRVGRDNEDLEYFDRLKQIVDDANQRKKTNDLKPLKLLFTDDVEDTGDTIDRIKKAVKDIDLSIEVFFAVPIGRPDQNHATNTMRKRMPYDNSEASLGLSYDKNNRPKLSKNKEDLRSARAKRKNLYQLAKELLTRNKTNNSEIRNERRSNL